MRVFDHSGLNVVLDPLTGLLDRILGLLFYRLGDINFLQQPEIIEGAFDNLRLHGDAGILYLIDKKTGSLVEVATGLLTTLKTIAPISGVLDVSVTIGFEITDNGTGIIACLLEGGAGTELRLLNLLDGTTNLLGNVTHQLLDITSLPDAAADTLVVTNTNNDGPGSLRQAIITSNLSIDTEEIIFNIPGTGPHTIHVSAEPISIIGSVDIVGSSQPGYAGSPVITLAPDPLNAPDRLLDVAISLAGANITDVRFEGAAGMDSLVRLDTVGSVVSNCEFDGNGTPVDGIVVGGVALNNTILNCRIHNCDDGLLQAIVGASTAITNCDIRNNSIGLHFALNIGLQVLSNTAAITGCTITGNTGAGVRNSGGIVSRVLIRENSIFDNGGLGIDNFSSGVTANNNDLLDDLGVLGGRFWAEASISL